MEGMANLVLWRLQSFWRETWGAGAGVASTMSVLAASMAFTSKYLSSTPIRWSPANKFMFMAEQQQLVHDFRIVCMGLGSRLNPKLILLRSGPVHALLPQYMKIKHVNYHKKAMVSLFFSFFERSYGKLSTIINIRILYIISSTCENLKI